MTNWKIEITNPSLGGYAPGWYHDSYPNYGNANQAGDMTNCDLTNPASITQGPGLSTLTSGTEAGNVTTLIKGISRVPTSSDLAFAVGGAKLYEITSTAVSTKASDPALPHTISQDGGETGEDVCYFQGNLYYSYNQTGQAMGDVGKYDLTRDAEGDFDDDWLSQVPTGKFDLTNDVPHPLLAAGNDYMYIGNGRYVSSWDGTTATEQDLDLPTGSEITDLEWNDNRLFIAANYPNLTGTNNNNASIFIWDGNADSWETEIKVQGRIGALHVKNGVVFVFYQDISYTGGYKLGYINGNSITDLAHFKGALPLYYQTCTYKDFIIWVGSDVIYAWGGGGKDIPVRSFQLADGGYSTVGGLGIPFGTPFVASNQSTSYKLAKFSGYDVNSAWKSLCFQVGESTISKMKVYHDTLGASAQADFTITYDRGSGTNTAGLNLTADTDNTHTFDIGQRVINDFRVDISWANGSATNPVKINKIEFYGTKQSD